MKKRLLLPLAALCASYALASCSETIDTAEQRRSTNERQFLSFADSTGYQRTQLPGNLGDRYVYIKWVQRGSGTETPASNELVKIRYRGYLTSDWVTNARTAQPFEPGNWGQVVLEESRVSSYIPGFRDALQSLHPGDEVYVVIPWYLGYGAALTRAVPTYSSLLFQLKLEEIVPEQ